MPFIGQRIISTDAVQGVDQWMVEIAIDTGSGYGGYTELTAVDPVTGNPYSNVGSGYYYNCPSSLVGSGDTEHVVWSFSFGYTIPEAYSIHDRFKFRFTPSGYDLGNGSTIDSTDYTVLTSMYININGLWKPTQNVYVYLDVGWMEVNSFHLNVEDLWKS
jgi:hypothetical protein